MPFKDVYKLSAPFGMAGDGITPLPLDKDGYVTAIPANVSLPHSYSAAVHTLSPPITGHACSNASGTDKYCTDQTPLSWEMYTFTYTGNCSGCRINGVHGTTLDATNHSKWLVNVSGTWLFEIYHIDPGTYPRDFKLFPARFTPEEVAAEPWNPAWVALLQQPQTKAATHADVSPPPAAAPATGVGGGSLGVFRFMDWSQTNLAYQKNQTWPGRTLPTDATQMNQAGGGVAFEWMIALANKLGVDPWVNIPHTADDVFVRGLATLLKGLVDEQRTTYIEFSNEVWNFGFEQYKYAAEMGFRAGLDTSPGETAANRWYSDRVCQIKAIFDEVYGGAEHAKSRLNRVMATWTNVPPDSGSFPVTMNTLTWHDNHRCVDSVAVTGYFGLGKDSSDTKHDTCWLANRTVDEFIAIWNNESSWQQWIQVHEAQAEYVATFGHLELVAYEAGLGLGGTPHDPCAQSLAALMPKVLRDPRVAGIAYRNIVEFSRLRNATLMNIFSTVGWSNKIYGDWGQLEYMDSAGTDGGYKYAGMQKWLSEQPPSTQ